MSLAGPFANIMVALFTGILIRYLLLPWDLYRMVLIYMLFMNIGLGVFNLLPLPPLDGSHVMENAFSPAAAQKYRQVGRYGLPVFIGIIFLDSFLHTRIFSRLLIGPITYLAHLFAGDNLVRLVHLLS